MSRQNNGKRPLVPKRKSNKIIFFDIDGTLIIDREKNRLKEIKKAITKIKSNKIIFGINTNRPWTETKKIYKSLSLNGPVICENGSYYLPGLNHQGKSMFKLDENLKDKIVVHLKNTPVFADYKIIIGDNKGMLSKKQISGLILITSSRKYTASIYIRMAGKVIKEVTRKAFNILKTKFPGLKVEILTENGKIIISNPKVDKISTLHFLAEKYFKSYNIFMVSDQEEIKKKFPDINFCGIKESNKAYKINCRYISDRQGIDGVLDIINNYL